MRSRREAIGRQLTSTVLAAFAIVSGLVFGQPTAVGASPPNLAWQPCEGAPTAPLRECAVVDVPLDYDNPALGTTPLHIARVQAGDSDNRKGTLLVLPGGPPSAGVSFVGYAANLNRSVSPELQANYDLIGIQQIGSWDGVPCASGPFLKEYWETSHLPKTTTQLHNVMRLEHVFNDGCTSAGNRLVPYMSTSRSIRDMETVRQALQVEKMSLLGFSYGTALAHGYMSAYPAHVNRAVLDSVVDRLMPDPIHDKENNLAYERSWGLFKQWCNTDAACPLQGQDLDEVFDTALAAARTTGIPAPNNPFGAGQLNDWELTVGMQALTGAGEATRIWAATVLEEAANSDGSQGDYLYDLLTGRRPDGSYLGGDGTRRAFSCNDSIWSQVFRTPESVRQWAQLTKQVAPRYGAASVYQGVAQCYKWSLKPVSPPPRWQPVPSNGESALLISGRQDASTPLIWAERVQKQIAGSRLVIVNGASHLQIARSRCAATYATAYLLTGELPADRAQCEYDPDLNPPQLPPPLGAQHSSKQQDMFKESAIEGLPARFHPQPLQ